ncbi:DUF1109 domain-containing protein [Sphingomonas sp. SUN039]|uniref:DUF1109 domain-containing protein n=1 Tax=Sphingomonas sp. SUN039 TaxID=2937787 RepID=UPI002164D455|nr:DUF1109 domain-containing protein [Sphingomonas sp. SUN039]UVO54588.1 DUF1109 domain-containing protein [Sphingomonas sp. SUN039]
MDTDALIEALARDTAPVPRHAAPLRLGLSLFAGMAATLVLIAATLGFRPDLDLAMAGTMFWMKLSYTASLALVAIAALLTLIRPEARPPRWLWLLTIPVALLGLVSAHELAEMPHDDWLQMWFGRSWSVCSPLIAVFAVPIAGALVLVVRQFAPTRLRATGAVIGLASGAASATLYSLHCPEAGASFVLTWYSLGIAAATAAGWALGPKLLRW